MSIFSVQSPNKLRAPNPRKRGLSIPHPITSSFYHPFRYREIDRNETNIFCFFRQYIPLTKSNFFLKRACALDVHGRLHVRRSASLYFRAVYILRTTDKKPLKQNAQLKHIEQYHNNRQKIKRERYTQKGDISRWKVPILLCSATH